MTIVKCETCGKEFNKPLNKIKKTNHNFCCNYCFGIGKSRKIVKLSPYYKKEIIKINGKIILNETIELDNSIKIAINSIKYGLKYCEIDKCDIDKIQKYKWYIRYDKSIKNFYVFSRYKHTTINIHRLITDCPKDMVVDHINHNTLDNRRSNLKICTQAENLQNLRMKNNNTSGIQNISFNKNRNKWKYSKTINGVLHVKEFKGKYECILYKKEYENKNIPRNNNKLV